MGSGEASSAAAACLHIQESWLRLLLAAVGERQLLRSLLLAIREVRQQAVIREIERVRVLLVEFDDRVQPVHDWGVAHLDRELAPAVEAPGGKVDRPDDGGDEIGRASCRERV